MQLLFAASDASSYSLASLLPRLFLSMAIVIFVMWLAARFMKNRQVAGSGIIRKAPEATATEVQVLSRQGLGRTASIAVVQIGGRSLVVGITENNVTLITDLGSDPSTSGPQQQAHQQIVATAAEVAQVRSITHIPSTSHRTGSQRTTATRPSSMPARKGLLEQVREMTVRH